MTDLSLIVPRRNFLIRALGFTAAGATLSIPVLVAEGAQKRADYHMRELTKALQEMYPHASLSGGMRDFEAWCGMADPGDIIATVAVDGEMQFAADRRIITA